VSEIHVIVVGASAGGVEGLMSIARALPANLPAAVFMVLHVPPQGGSVLPQLLDRAGRLPAAHAKDGQPILPGRIYVAPPDHHMTLHGDQIRLSHGPSENGHRPAIDPLFRSAARWHAERVIGVVLSGSLDDGTAGLFAVKLASGTTVVQDPGDALYPSMPQSALDSVDVDHVSKLSELGDLLAQLAERPVARSLEGERVPRGVSSQEIRVAKLEPGSTDVDGDEYGKPSAFACPECHGVLWELQEGKLVRFRCRVGHSYLPQSLSAAQSERAEEALWSALRTLRENAALSDRLAERARARSQSRVVAIYEARAREANERATSIEALLRVGIQEALLAGAENAAARPPLPAERGAVGPQNTEPHD
jgi:two-component system chemotaxis response regulator CheB